MSKVLDFNQFKNFNILSVEDSTLSAPNTEAIDFLESMYFDSPSPDPIMSFNRPPHRLTGNVREDVNDVVSQLLELCVYYSKSGDPTPEFVAIGRALYGYADFIENKNTPHKVYLDTIASL